MSDQQLAISYRIERAGTRWRWTRPDTGTEGKTRRLAAAISACRRNAREKGMFIAVIAVPARGKGER